MKSLLKIFILSFSFLLILQSALAIVVPITDPSDAKSKSGTEKGEETVKLLGPDAISFLNLTPRQYYEITGEKMKFKERMALKMAQRELRNRCARANEANNQGNLKSGNSACFGSSWTFNHSHRNHPGLYHHQDPEPGNCPLWRRNWG
jgi:hypothetical protein